MNLFLNILTRFVDMGVYVALLHLAQVDRCMQEEYAL